ncbi:MAG: hypothetical protein ABW162_18335 [Candidatus Sedimenticola sp. PURPLELP]
MVGMVLKSQDVYVLLKLAALGAENWSYSQLGHELGMSPSQVHSAVKRAVKAGLAIDDGGNVRPNIRNLSEFLQHGIQYVFVPDRGELTRGVATAYAAPVMEGMFALDGEPPPVWPDAEGSVRGIGFSPLHKSAPRAAQRDARLYELLALVDMIRGGRARERAMATRELKNRLENYVGPKSEH